MIDWDRVRDLKEEIGDDDFEEVVAMFLEEVDTLIVALDPAAPGAEGDLHSLKSAALNLGFARFATLCGDGERIAAQGGTPDLAPIRAAYTASRTEFAAQPP